MESSVNVSKRGKKPSSLRYYQDGPPVAVDISAWKLEVCGLGTSGIELSFEDILKLPQVEQNRRMVCVCNWSIRELWQGVLLSDVLRLAGLDDPQEFYLKQVSIGTPEKGTYEATIPLKNALENRALLCHSLEGSPLPLERGYPLRLLDFNLYGYKNVKGLKRIEVTDNYELGKWEKKAGYSLDGTIRPKRYWAVDLCQHKFVSKPGEATEF